MGSRFQSVEKRAAVRGRVLLVAPSPPPYGGMALQAGLLRELLRRDGQSVTLLASNFQLPAVLRWAGCVPGLRTAARFLLIWWKLWRAASAVEIVHVFAASWLYFYLVVWPAVLVGRLRGTRVVLNYRGGEAASFFRRNRWAAAPVFRLAHVVTVPSDFLARILTASFHTAVRIVPNLLDTTTFHFRERKKFEPKLVVARHLEAIYDIETVLKAFRRIQQRHPEASLAIAGSGSQESALRDLAAGWQLRNVRFLGHVPHGDLAALYDSCDIFLNASRVDNFPGALVEASAAGLVVVSTDAGGIRYIYEHDKDALLAAVGAWEDLADRVERVIESPSLGARLAQQALLLVRSCDWAEVRNALYDAYGLTVDRQAAAEFAWNAPVKRAAEGEC